MSIAIEKRGDAGVYDAVDVDRFGIMLLHGADEAFVILLGWGVEGDGDVDIFHAESADAGSFIGKGALMTVQTKVDDDFDAQGGKAVQLGLAWLTG